MSLVKVRAAVMVAASVGALAIASSAHARGCNGVVNQFVWGCAAWDNNNGPQYPNWHGPTRQPARVEVNRSAAPKYSPNVRPDLINRNGAGVIPAGAGNLISHDGGSVISHDAGSFGH